MVTALPNLLGILATVVYGTTDVRSSSNSAASACHFGLCRRASEGSDSGDPADSIFSKVGSPALVLAFLAIGLFAGGVVSILFLRRFGSMNLIRQRQMALQNAEVRGWAAGVAAAAAEAPTLGEKPKLWDVHAVQSSDKKRIPQWASITPLAVGRVQISVPAQSPEPPKSKWRSRQQKTWRWLQGLAPPSPPEMLPPVEESVIQLAVSVIMPSKRHARPRASDEEYVPVYEVGTVTLPWTSNQVSATSNNDSTAPARESDRGRIAPAIISPLQ